MAVCPWVAMCAELVTPSCRALVTLSRRCETVWPMDWICPALCDCVCATERRSRRSSESWDSSAELFLWLCAICRASQRMTRAKTTAAMSTAEFIDYYFTRTKKNSPPTWGAEKRKSITTGARGLERVGCGEKAAIRERLGGADAVKAAARLPHSKTHAGKRSWLNSWLRSFGHPRRMPSG